MFSPPQPVPDQPSITEEDVRGKKKKKTSRKITDSDLTLSIAGQLGSGNYAK